MRAIASLCFGIAVLLCSTAEGQSYEPIDTFIRGDANLSNTIDLADAITVLDNLFAGGVLNCLDAADCNDDGTVDIGDPIFLLDLLFSTGPNPVAPYPELGLDPTFDFLTCQQVWASEVYVDPGPYQYITVSTEGSSDNFSFCGGAGSPDVVIYVAYSSSLALGLGFESSTYNGSVAVTDLAGNLITCLVPGDLPVFPFLGIGEFLLVFDGAAPGESGTTEVVIVPVIK